MHIDHIMPQSADSSWRKSFPEFDKHMHTLPNLVIMSAATNERKSDKTWTETLEFLPKGSRFFSVNELLKIKEWNQEAMAKRMEALQIWATKHWKR
jgi:hypothetical protein